MSNKKTRIMRKTITLITAILAIVAFFTACEEDNSSGTGTMELAITDAPVDNENITGVYITVEGLQYHKQDSAWKTFEEYEGPKTFNLLNLTDGVTGMLGSFEMKTGQYNQLRFMLDIADRSGGTPSNPGCYLEFSDGSKTPLFVPSGGQSGYKATGAFKVPSNGTVKLVADWDARKAVVEAGATGRYILRPTIRLIANNEAGSISGGITDLPAEYDNIAVYAYEDGTYDSTQAEIRDEEVNRFPDAVTSDVMGEENGYRLSFLAPIKYDLVVTKTINGEFDSVLGIQTDVEVESKKNTSQNISISELSSQ
jgi:hypothetical protein